MKAIWLKNKRFSEILAIQMIELILVATSLVFTYMIAGVLIYNDSFPYGSFTGTMFSVLASAVAVIILSAKKYFNFLDTSFNGIMGKVIWIVLLINFILIIMIYFGTTMRLTPYYFIIAATLQVGFLLLIKLFTSMLKRRILSTKSCLILGNKEEKNILLQSFQKSCDCNLKFIDINDENIKKDIEKADYVYLMSSTHSELKNFVVEYCEINNKRLFIVPEIHEIAMRNSEMTQISDIPLFTIEGFQLTEAQLLVKRIMDVGFSLMGIILTMPIIAVFAILIKAEDGGPVFFRQVRTGINGNEFMIIKLRSMIVDAEKYTGTVLAKEDDPRITKVGKFMRAARIDEFPQFYNVLFGSMSIVGPRPERPVFVENFCNKSLKYKKRLSVKPGITGLAQILANYATTSENKLKFDLIYIKEYSPLLDLKILFKTVKVLFSKEKSKGVSDPGKVFDVKFEEDIMEEGDSWTGVRTRRRKTYNYLRASLIVFCCLIIVSVSFVMRYSSLVITLMEATVITVEEINDLNLEEIKPLSELEAELPINTMAAKQETEENKIIAEAEMPMASLPNQSIASTDQNRKIFENMTLRQKIGLSYELVKNLSLEDITALDKLSEDGFSEDEILLIKGIIAQRFNEEERSNLKKLLASV